VINNQRQSDSQFNFATIIDFLLKYKTPLIIITLAAGLLSFIFSSPFFIPPKYKSTVILFPATTNSISKAILNYTPSAKTDFLAFGQEEEAEQLLQLLQSDKITNRIEQKYNLMRHYRIPADASYPKTKLGKKFGENVTYRRTEFMSIEISVLDESPDTAAMIANDIAALVDSTKNAVQHERAQEALKIVQGKYEEKQHFIDKMVDSLQKIGELGVFNYVQQGNAMSNQNFAGINRNLSPAAMKEMDKEKKLLGKYGPIQKSLLDRIEFENEDLSKLHALYEQSKVDAEQALPATFIINKAYPAEKKFYPVRWIIVLISMSSALLLSILLFAVLQNYKEYKKQRIHIVQPEERFVDAE
jgi:uncharacterized protein involved in exopolysaccharide biosynthesis